MADILEGFSSLLEACEKQKTVSDLLQDLSNNADLNDIVEQLKKSPFASLIGNIDMKDVLQEKEKPSTPQKKEFTRTKPFAPQRESVSLICPYDIREMETCYMVYFDVPGVAKIADISLESEEGRLILQVEKTPYSIGSDHFIYKERSFGTYKADVKLPDTADVAQTSAKYENGVLQVKVPKINKCIKKKIPIYL